jgi:hypothetical protein
MPSPPLQTAAPRHHGLRHRTCLPVPLQCRVSPLGVSPSPLGPNRAAPCPGHAPSRQQHPQPRPSPPAITARPRWWLLRPNRGYQPTLVERVVRPDLFPDRARRRFAGVGRSRAARRSQGPNCLVANLCRVKSVNQGHIWENLFLSRDLVARVHFQ